MELVIQSEFHQSIRNIRKLGYLGIYLYINKKIYTDVKLRIIYIFKIIPTFYSNASTHPTS